MQHTFKVTSPELKEKTIVSRLIAYGDPDNDTAIARTVALPAAIAAKLILEKKITLTGVIRPINPELYNPILSELEREGIYLKESN
ncbi:MAG TPA: saccharopine dehydrogenase C-terminal domain-containing protein, partial [Bacteroidales bacterium]|nr:saccharopine dehydrogenase C-terminal domain-containing protein [Bacteroidales bacterium]